MEEKTRFRKLCFHLCSVFSLKRDVYAHICTHFLEGCTKLNNSCQWGEIERSNLNCIIKIPLGVTFSNK